MVKCICKDIVNILTFCIILSIIIIMIWRIGNGMDYAQRI